jgi:hypothetical protein
MADPQIFGWVFSGSSATEVFGQSEMKAQRE